jgi:tetratricopeptide (TPR) repeat protein
LTASALRARAHALHNAGQFAAAEEIYAEILRRDPGDVAALTASAAALRELGRPSESLARANAAIARQPTLAGVCCQGIALRDLGRLGEALASFERATTLAPQSVEAHNYRGLTQQQLGRFAEALASFEAALVLNPQLAELHSNRANVLRRLRRLPEALASCEQAIALRPTLAVAHNNCGLVLYALGRHEAAAASYRRALELQPDSADVYNNLGAVQAELGEPEAAVASYRRALELRPDLPGLHGNLGNALRDLGRPEQALAEYDLAVQEAPDAAASHCHRGNALQELRRFPEALASYDRAIALDPRHALAHFNKGLCLLLAADFAQGLPLYEWRKRTGGGEPAAFAGVSWDGTAPLRGQRLLVYADQALGDTLQFCRLAKLTAARGAAVVLRVQPPLRELLETLSPTIRVVAADAPAEPCDLHCALMSLPLALGLTASSIPAEVPYLAAQPQRIERWQAWLRGGGLRIGIAWQGSRNRIDVGRSAPLEMFAPLASVPGVRLVSLQKGAALAQLRALPVPFAVETPAEPFDEGPQAFLDSAALMSVLDLVITCDTALAHLAGALGRPTWVALKQVPDWRWQLDRSDTPWYPSLRLFRQPRRGDWRSVFAAMRGELERLAQERAREPAAGQHGN